MSAPRFSKAAALRVLDQRASAIASGNKFNRSHGTAQLTRSRDTATLALIDLAVEYGRMRAYEEFACAIEEGFRFDLPAEGAKNV
jgi:hypothetical protein